MPQVLEKFMEINENFQLIGVELSGGNVHDSEMAIKLLADNAFCSEEIRNFAACIPDMSNAVVIHEFDEQFYKTRNIIERFFYRIKNYRHISTRYDKLSVCFFEFRSACSRHDSNLDFTNSP